MLRERPEDAAAACDLGVPKSLATLLSRANGETGEAALALLAALADDAAARERLRQARHAKKHFRACVWGEVCRAVLRVGRTMSSLQACLCNGRWYRCKGLCCGAA